MRRTICALGRASEVRATTKAKTDAAKSKNNGRYAKRIIMAVKAGGPDLGQNRLLAQLVTEAKLANVPKDIVTRNIEKASSLSTENFKESVFEFYGHGGVSLLVNVLSDNDNRASNGINLVARKNSLKLAATNSVLFRFEKKARLDLACLIDENLLMELCLENGVDDYDIRTTVDGCPLNPSEDGKSVVYVNMKDMAVLRDALRAKDIHVETKLAYLPLEGFVSLNDVDFDANMTAIEAFESLDDVDSIEHNINMTDEA